MAGKSQHDMALVEAMLYPHSGCPSGNPVDIPDRNSCGTASQQLKTIVSIQKPESTTDVWDVVIVTSPFPQIAFFYSRRSDAANAVFENWRAVPRTTYPPSKVGQYGTKVDDVFTNAVARYRGIGHGAKIEYTGPTLSDQGRFTAAQLPNHVTVLNTRPGGVAVGAGGVLLGAPKIHRTYDNQEGVVYYNYAVGDPLIAHGATNTRDNQEVQGTSGGRVFLGVDAEEPIVGNWETQGSSSQVGFWFDMPPTTEEKLRQATPSSISGKAKDTLMIRTDIDSGVIPWIRSTSKLQLGVSSVDGGGSEPDGDIYFMPFVPGPANGTAAPLYWEVNDASNQLENRMAMTGAMDFKVTVATYVGIDSAATLTYSDSLYLAVDPQVSGPLAPNRTAPVGVRTSLVDEIIDVQTRTPSLWIVPKDAPESVQRGIVGNILGGVAGTLGPALNGMFGGNLGNLVGAVGPSLGAMLPW